MGGKQHQARRQVAVAFSLTLFILKGCFEGSDSISLLHLFLFLLYFSFIKPGKIHLIDHNLIGHLSQIEMKFQSTKLPIDIDDNQQLEINLSCDDAVTDVNHQAGPGGLAGRGFEDKSGGRGRQWGGAKGISSCGFTVSIQSLLSIEFFFLSIRHMLWILTVICFYWLADEKHGREKTVFIHLLKLPLEALELEILFFYLKDFYSDSDIFSPRFN